MRIIIALGILIALAVIGVTYTDNSDNGSGDQSNRPQNKSEIIFNAIKKKGIEVEDAYTSNGSEIKKAFGLEDSNIGDDATIAFIIFRYSTSEGVDKKTQLVLEVIYTTLLAEPSIDGVLVMPYDSSVFVIGGGTNLVYTNRSHAQEMALQNLPLVKSYNSFDIYTIISEVNEG